MEIKKKTLFLALASETCFFNVKSKFPINLKTKNKLSAVQFYLIWLLTSVKSCWPIPLIRVVDPKYFFSDLDPTLTLISDPDPDSDCL